MPLALSIPAATTAYTMNSQKNRLLQAGPTAFAYDNEGQLATKTGAAYTFDDAHRLTGMTAGTAVNTYRYDGAGHRLEATRSGVVTRYIYDTGGNLLAEADAGNVIRKYYIYGDGLLSMVTSAGAMYCYHFDGTGHTIALTDAGATVVNKYVYTPFGQVANQLEGVAQPFKYAGKYGVMAEDNGLYFMRARYYDPGVGRFISEDPMGFGGGDVNLMAYVLNDPVNLVDPEGLSHIGFIKLLSEMANKGVKKTIKSLEKQIAKHEEAIIDPMQKLAKQHHEHELEVFKGQLDLANNEAVKRGLMGGIVGVIGSLLDPFDAISGELSSDDMLYPNGFPNSTGCHQ